MPVVGFELTTPRSRVVYFTEWASQEPHALGTSSANTSYLSHSACLTLYVTPHPVPSVKTNMARPPACPLKIFAEWMNESMETSPTITVILLCNSFQPMIRVSLVHIRSLLLWISGEHVPATSQSVGSANCEEEKTTLLPRSSWKWYLQRAHAYEILHI